MNSRKVIHINFKNGTASVESDKGFTLYNVQGKSCVRKGVLHPAPVHHGHHMTVLPGESIRVFGKDIRRNPQTREFEEMCYDVTFKVGDTVVYDSYNLKYLGVIKKITAKTVVVSPEDCEKDKYLSFYDISRKNAFFDLEAIRKANLENAQCL